LYYSLTPSLNLVAEYIPTTAENQAGQEIKDKVLALGPSSSSEIGMQQ